MAENCEEKGFFKGRKWALSGKLGQLVSSVLCFHRGKELKLSKFEEMYAK